ncbi:substrate-binding domain-containing protein [Falsihalocynthiibacter sp. SS001]|uniref:substrate-binding domain-containing protein n=1 Tax=Falsihalocynthiibacter sp. SS001 TaxID=3349698 RepID=UPI0036D3DDE8
MMRTLFAGLALIASMSMASAETIRMAVTTSFHNSGLSDILVPAIKEDLGLDVELLVVGTGQALRLGEAGDVDAILVHSRSAEEEFVAQGYGLHRREIMYNDFVFIGSKDDPADIAEAQSVTDVLTRIAISESVFVSRGDDSGTHKRERALWEEAGIDPAGDWHRELGTGMGGTLNTAAGMNAYLVSDRASWLNFGNKGDLALLYSGDHRLFNQYAYLPVNPALHPHVKAELAASLEEWLVGDHAKSLINDYEINGETLFTFNAQN